MCLSQRDIHYLWNLKKQANKHLALTQGVLCKALSQIVEMKIEESKEKTSLSRSMVFK